MHYNTGELEWDLSVLELVSVLEVIQLIIVINLDL
jgi:hypothetical protein